MTPVSHTNEGGRFRHEALLYSSDDEFLEHTCRFIVGGLTADAPVLVMVSGDKIDRLRGSLNRDADRVEFVDMTDVGRNPARIIPVWQDFIDRHRLASQLRGIGEPIDSTRSSDELAECHLHESLLDVAFSDVSSFWLMCPYDRSNLDETVIADAQRNHRFLFEDGRHQPCDRYLPMDTDRPHGVAGELPGPPEDALSMPFGGGMALAAPRQRIGRFLAGCGLSDPRRSDLLLAASELLANSVRHGGGTGTMHAWADEESVVVEVADEGHIVDPLVGRIRPGLGVDDSRGLWLANQLCDLVQIRSTAAGTTVRLHTGRR